MKKTGLSIFVFLFLFPLVVLATDSNGTITVNITDCRDDKGEVVVTLYNSKDGFPEKPEKAIKKVTGKIKDGKSQVVFSDVPYGEYAVSILHDENVNGKMDKSMLGIPKEGNGASNNPESFGPPKFKDAKFDLNSDNSSIEIKMKYL